MEDLHNIQDLLRPDEVELEETEEAAPEQEAETLENKIEEENI